MMRIALLAVASAAALPIPDVIISDDHDHLDLFADASLAAEGRQLAETTMASTATPKTKTTPGLSQMRFKLAQQFCPTASDAEKGLLACKAFAIATQIKTAKEETEKKKLTEQRKALYAEAAKMTDSDKKAAGAAHKAMYQKAYGSFCGEHKSNSVCINDTMKKMYGGMKAIGQAKAIGAKKATKKAAAA